jgi:hypothetical protein
MNPKHFFLAGLLILMSGMAAADNETLSANLTVIYTGNLLVNQSSMIEANYSYENGTVIGSDVCRLDAAVMSLNMSSGLYYISRSYPLAGNYTHDVMCQKEGFLNRTQQIIISVLQQNITFQNITANVDLDNDTYMNDTDCNDTSPQINPGMQEILYNNIDDDCNPFTLDYLIFNVSIAKTIYSPLEAVGITIFGTNGSDTYITISTPANVSYVYIFANGSYPVVQQFSLTGLSGPYTIEAMNYYGDYTRSAEASFSVSSNMDAEIQLDKTLVYAGDQVHFKAVITGSVGQANLVWNLDDNSEKYSAEFDYAYVTPKTYNVVLIVTDQGGNQVVKTRSITVLPKLYMKVIVRDNSTSALLPNASVEVDDEKRYLNASGMAEFTVTNKTHELKVKSDGYYTYKEDLKVNSSLIFTVFLNKDLDSYAPNVTLVSPENNTEISRPEFKFKFMDYGTADCSLFVSEGNGWWLEANSSANLSPGTEYAFMPNISSEYTMWKMQCTDDDGNTGTAGDYSFTLKEDVQESGQADVETYNIVQNIYDIIPDFSTYSPDEKKIVEYLKMDVLIKDAKRRLEMANRDLYNLRLEPDTDSLLKKREEIYARIDAIKDETPLSLSVQNKAEFVRYLEEDELEELFTQYMALKNPGMSKSEKAALLQTNEMLQKKATVQTHAYNILVDYISGRSQHITLIAREVQFDSPKSGIMYVEVIPKDIAESADEITFLTPVSVLEKDPVFEVALSSHQKIVYYMEKDLDLDALPQIRPALMTMQIEESSRQITGFAIFDKLGFTESNRNIFMIQIVVVFILLGIYMFFYFTSGGRESTSFASEQSQQYSATQTAYPAGVAAVESQPALMSGGSDKLQYIQSLMKKASGQIDSDIEDAAMSYHELKFLFDLLPEHEKCQVYDDLQRIGDEITSRYVNTLIGVAIVQLAHGNKEQAKALYEEIEAEFTKLSTPYQEKVYPKCCEIALHLKNG